MKTDKACIDELPFVSIVIAARNEEESIERRIGNLNSQEYPKEKMEIIVISDGSNDNTNDIVGTLSGDLNKQFVGCDDYLKLISYNTSRGKPHALNVGVAEAKGEIIVFADCRQRFEVDVINQLVANFNDTKVGCVSGELIFEETPGSRIEKEMGAYWNFEKSIRKLESKTGSVPGATGAIYAIRKDMFRRLPKQALLDDVLVPLNICMEGYRTIFDSSARAFDVASKDISQEKKRKIRTLAGNWQLLALQHNLFNPIRNPIWFKFISHKIFRLLVPYSAIVLVAAALLWRNCFSISILYVFVFFGLLAIIPPIDGPFRKISKITKISRALILLNYFALIAPLRLIRSSRSLW